MKRLLITSLCLMFGLLLRGQTFNPNGTIVVPGNNNAVTFCASDELGIALQSVARNEAAFNDCMYNKGYE